MSSIKVESLSQEMHAIENEMLKTEKTPENKSLIKINVSSSGVKYSIQLDNNGTYTLQLPEQARAICLPRMSKGGVELFASIFLNPESSCIDLSINEESLNAVSNRIVKSNITYDELFLILETSKQLSFTDRPRGENLRLLTRMLLSRHALKNQANVIKKLQVKIKKMITELSDQEEQGALDKQVSSNDSLSVALELLNSIQISEGDIPCVEGVQDNKLNFLMYGSLVSDAFSVFDLMKKLPSSMIFNVVFDIFNINDLQDIACRHHYGSFDNTGLNHGELCKIYDYLIYSSEEDGEQSEDDDNQSSDGVKSPSWKERAAAISEMAELSDGLLKKQLTSVVSEAGKHIDGNVTVYDEYLDATSKLASQLYLDEEDDDTMSDVSTNDRNLEDFEVESNA